MTESQFTQSIMRKLDKRIYKWKIMNMMQNGVPDCYFSGPAGDLWVEFKYIKVPKRDTTEFKPKLSALQLKWLNERYDEGRNVAVILGSDIGSAIFIDRWWNGFITWKYLVSTKQDIVKWIETQTLG